MTVTLQFYRGPARAWWQRTCDAAVRWRTSGPYSHVELQDGYYGWTSSWLDGGVRRKAINFASGRWVAVTFPGDQAAALAWFAAHEGQSYDVFGLLGWVLPWRVSDRTRWFCSEAVAEALGRSATWRISPNDLYLAVQQERAA